MMLLSLAASYAESRDCRQIYYGAQAQDEYGYWDCTEEFLEKINNVFLMKKRRNLQRFKMRKFPIPHLQTKTF